MTSDWCQTQPSPAHLRWKSRWRRWTTNSTTGPRFPLRWKPPGRTTMCTRAGHVREVSPGDVGISVHRFWMCLCMNMNKPRIRNFPRISNKESETKTRESETRIRESETKIPRIRNQKPRESETKIQESDTKHRESETENKKLKIANQTPRSANQKPNKPTNQKPKKRI